MSPTRRDFLKATGAAIAAPSLLIGDGAIARAEPAPRYHGFVMLCVFDAAGEINMFSDIVIQRNPNDRSLGMGVSQEFRDRLHRIGEAPPSQWFSDEINALTCPVPAAFVWGDIPAPVAEELRRNPPPDPRAKRAAQLAPVLTRELTPAEWDRL